MIIVNSVSGGKTSAYMAVHYPADVNVFALVLIDCKKSVPRDKGLIEEVKKRVPNFVATHEDDQTLKAVLNLEQYLGQEIKWVSSEFALEQFVRGTTDLPGYRSAARLFDSRTRFCTIEQKIRPIANYLEIYENDGDPVLMQIGFRADEPKRVESWNCKNDKIKIPVSCNLKTRRVSYNFREWRVADFPLYRDRITKSHVADFWKDKIDFPEISNCRFCPFHTDIQLQRQAQKYPENLQWWLDLENLTGHTFDNGRPLIDRLNQALIPGIYNDDDLRSCHCTD